MPADKHPKAGKKKITHPRPSVYARAPKKPKPVPGLGRVRVWSSDPPLEVRALMSEERPNVESGYGGWQEIARPRRRPLTTWIGATALRMTLPLMLDGWAEGNSQEANIKRLTRMATATASDGEPPLVHISSPGNALPYQDRSWVVAELAWGEALMNDRGNRTRQQVTLTLLEFVADVYVTERSAATRRRKKAAAKKNKPGAEVKRVSSHKGKTSGAKTRAVTTGFAGGEDLYSLAARELGDATRAREVADLNDIRDPRSIKPGQVIRLP